MPTHMQHVVVHTGWCCRLIKLSKQVLHDILDLGVQVVIIHLHSLGIACHSCQRFAIQLVLPKPLLHHLQAQHTSWQPVLTAGWGSHASWRSEQGKEDNHEAVVPKCRNLA